MFAFSYELKTEQFWSVIDKFEDSDFKWLFICSNIYYSWFI